MGNTSQNSHNKLKDIDFLSWSINRSKARHTERAIRNILTARPRQRNADHITPLNG